MPKSKVNWKTVGVAIGSLFFLVGIIGGWMVTASKADDANKKAEKVDDKVQDLSKIVYEQRALNVSQQAYNADVVLILKELKKR